MIEEVILVDEFDNSIGTMEKLEAHQKGVLHRAFSIFLFNKQGELLIQRRSLIKYHSAGLWTNTCCSHPRPNEKTLYAANRRLKEEMGIETELIYKTHFTYKAKFENNLTEFEFDHIFTGIYNKSPEINLEEVDDFNWISLTDLKEKIKINPETFNVWFKIAVEKLF